MDFNFNDYKNKVYGCFVGKCVGGTLGIHREGKRDYVEVTYYDPIPDKMLPNDDLDLQVVNLEAVLKHGLPISRFSLTENWKYHVADTAPDEYGCSISNHALKIFPPLSGIYRNKMYAGLGGAIRSELWACLAPANPLLASTFAREDACCDHTSEGVYAEMFLSAVESAAFNQNDLHKLIDIGLSVIPNDSRLKHAFLDVIEWWNDSKDLLYVRECILKNYHSDNWTDVTINLSFMLLSLLSCENSFDKAICTAVSLGYDTDCTAATVGSIFGIMNPNGIDKKWTLPIGNSLVLSAGVINMHQKSTIDEFCDQIIALASSVQDYYDTKICLNVPKNYAQIPLAKPHLNKNSNIYEWKDGSKESIIAVNPFILTLVYPETIAAIPNKENKYILRIDNSNDFDIKGELLLSLPDYWTATPKDFSFSAKSGERIELAFTVNPDGKQNRMPLNILFLNFTVNGLRFNFEAGLPITYPWLKENLETGEKEIFEADSVYFNIPKGRYKYTAKLFSPMTKDIRIHTSSMRKFTFFLNGEQLYTNIGSWYGTFYAPTFHRSGFIKTEILKRDNIIEVIFEDGDEKEYYLGFSTTYGCAVWIDTFERRNF